MQREYLECGKIVRPHGVKGAFETEVYCDSPKVLCDRERVFFLEGGEYKARKVIHASPSGDRAIMSVEGIDTREAAQAARGTVFYLHRSDIPVRRGDMLIADMIGLPVYDADTGRKYGVIEDVSDAVRGKMYTIRTEDGKEALFPSVPAFIKEITPEGGMLIRPIPGFFEPYED